MTKEVMFRGNALKFVFNNRKMIIALKAKKLQFEALSNPIIFMEFLYDYIEAALPNSIQDKEGLLDSLEAESPNEFLDLFTTAQSTLKNNIDFFLQVVGAMQEKEAEAAAIAQ